MLTFRTALAAFALVAAAVEAQPALAGVSADVGHRDRERYDRDDYRTDGGYHRAHYRKWRKAKNYCFTDTDVRFRFGARVRVVKRVCFDRYGRPYVASRYYAQVRAGSRW